MLSLLQLFNLSRASVSIYYLMFLFRDSFPLWRTIPQDKIFLSDTFFLDILTRCDVNPVFVDTLGLPGVGAAGHSVARAETALHSFREPTALRLLFLLS